MKPALDDDDIRAAAPRPSRARHEAHVAESGGYSAQVWEPDVTQDGVRLGYFGIEICTTCHYIVQTVCLHDVNKWDEGGKTLTCQLCGQDVT